MNWNRKKQKQKTNQKRGKHMERKNLKYIGNIKTLDDVVKCLRVVSVRPSIFQSVHKKCIHFGTLNN
jgi:hypothetical protein